MAEVVIVFAMEGEARPFLDAVGAVAEPVAGPGPVEWHRAQVGGRDVVVSVNGRDRHHGVELIGTQPATLATYLSVTHHRPEVVISAGTAGGWEAHGTRIGQVFLSTDRFWFHDRRIALPGFDDYGLGGYPGSDTTELARLTGLDRGAITTGNSLDETAEDRAAMTTSGARAKDMEAAAVAWVAHELGVPMFAVKSITDLVDHGAATPVQFQRNFAAATEALRDALVGVITAGR